MKSMNQLIIKGGLGRDARVSKVGERAVANFTVATEYEYKTKDGKWDKETTWHNVCAWQGYGICDFDSLKKGAKVLVTGRLRNRTYTDKSGVENTITELLAETVDILEAETAKKAPMSTVNSQSDKRYRDDDESF